MSHLLHFLSPHASSSFSFPSPLLVFLSPSVGEQGEEPPAPSSAPLCPAVPGARAGQGRASSQEPRHGLHTATRAAGQAAVGLGQGSDADSAWREMRAHTNQELGRVLSTQRPAASSGALAQQAGRAAGKHVRAGACSLTSSKQQHRRAQHSRGRAALPAASSKQQHRRVQQHR